MLRRSPRVRTCGRDVSAASSGRDAARRFAPASEGDCLRRPRVHRDGAHSAAEARPRQHGNRRTSVGDAVEECADAELVREAKRGHLNDPAALEQQVRRMLADDRAGAFVSRFFFRGCSSTNSQTRIRTEVLPGLRRLLRDGFAKETELFLLSQLREDRDPLDLWTADYTFLNEQVAKR